MKRLLISLETARNTVTAMWYSIKKNYRTLVELEGVNVIEI